MKRLSTLCSSIILVSVVASPAALGQWGAVKGQIVYGGSTIPVRKPLEVTTDKQVCLKHGPVLSEDWVVDKKTKGVRDVFVWIEPLKGKTMRIHPKLKALKEKKVVVDQPGCAFIPHVLALREGQTLLVKNSAPITHNFHWRAFPPNREGNISLPPGKSFEITDFKASRFPILMSCDIHKWMSGTIRVFNHPYYAVTKEDGTFEIPLVPAGKHRVFIWHRQAGWYGGTRGRNGHEVTIPSGGTLDLKVLKIK